MDRPPREHGRVAISQAQPDKGLPATSDRASRIALSNALVASFIRLGGQVYMEGVGHFGEGETGAELGG